MDGLRRDMIAACSYSFAEEFLGRTENVGSSNKPYGQFRLNAPEAKIDGCREASDNSGQRESIPRIGHKEEPR